MRHLPPVLALVVAVLALGCKPQPKAAPSNTDPQNSSDPQFQRPRLHREYRRAAAARTPRFGSRGSDDDYTSATALAPLRQERLSQGVPGALRADLHHPPQLPSILAQVQAATAGKKLDELERLSPGYTFFCTDTPFS
jgi:hypothetical protein